MIEVIRAVLVESGLSDAIAFRIWTSAGVLIGERILLGIILIVVIILITLFVRRLMK